MIRALAFIMTLIFIVAAPAPGVRAAPQAMTPDRSLAVVLDPSAMPEVPWMGVSARQALEEALRLDLPALPLRVRVGVWAGGARPLAAPRPAGDMQPAHISLPAPGAEVSGRESLQAAAAWLRSQGGGTILLAAGAGFSAQLPEIPPNIFIQVLALNPGGDGARLQELAAAGGGLYCLVERPGSLTRLLRRALQSAVSTSSLTLLTYDPDNRPLRLKLQVERADPKWPASSAWSGRPLQLPAGAWRLIWPEKTGLAEKELPRKAALDRGEHSRVWVGGRGELSVQGRSAQGGPLDWRVQVSRPRDGRLVTGYQGLPLMLSLPAGMYRVASLKPAHQWLVEVGAGAKASLTVGPPGRLLVEQPGPGGPLRLAFGVISRLSGRRIATGYSGEARTLPTGPYTLEMDPYPGRRRELTLEPGADLVLKLEAIGVVFLERGASAHPVAYELRDPPGRVVAQGVGPQRIPLLPGGYRLVVFPEGTGTDIKVTAGEMVRVRLP